MENMTKNLDLFGNPVPPKTKKISLKSIETRFRKVTIREDAPDWVTCRYTSPSQVFEMFSGMLKDAAKEHFITLHLDGKNRISCFDPVSIGSLNQSVVHPREVFATALKSCAAAIILLHNHPSGDPKPSREDSNLTRRLKEIGDLIGIPVLDHIIIGDMYYSFAEHGDL